MARIKRDGEYKYLNVSLPVDLLKRLEFALEDYLDKMQTSDKK